MKSKNIFRDKNEAGFREMASRGDVLQVNGGLIKFHDRYYDVCGKKAMMRIFESMNNPSRLYFYGEINGCTYFEWCLPGRDEFNLTLCSIGDDISIGVNSWDNMWWNSKKLRRT